MSSASEALRSVPVSALTSVWRLPSIRYARQGFPDWPAIRVPLRVQAMRATGTVPCEAFLVNGVVARAALRLAHERDAAADAPIFRRRRTKIQRAPADKASMGSPPGEAVE